MLATALCKDCVWGLDSRVVLLCPKHAATDALLKACKELREVSAACFRVIDSMAATDLLEEQLRALGIKNGFGVRAQAAIHAAEEKPNG